MFIGNNLSKILVITAAKKYKKQFLFICIGGCWEQGCFKARYWMKPQSKCHIFSPGKNSKVQASISKKKKTLSSKNNTSALFPTKKCSKSHNCSSICIVTLLQIECNWRQQKWLKEGFWHPGMQTQYPEWHSYQNYWENLTHPLVRHKLRLTWKVCSSE